jgi:hypothetical protein
MLNPPRSISLSSINNEYINPIRPHLNNKYIKVLICHNFEVEISSILENQKFLINIYVSPLVDILYRKSNGVPWQFDTNEEAWDFIETHQEFDLKLILIEFEKAFSTMRFNGEKDSQYHYCYHKIMNVREALGVFRTYQEVVNQNRFCSLTLNARFKFCQDSFGGYGYLHNFGYYIDREVNYINFTSKEVALFVDLNLPISKIVKSMNIGVIIEITKLELVKTVNTPPNYDIVDQETTRLNRIDNCQKFLQFLQEFG